MSNEYVHAMQKIALSDKEKQEITDWLVQAAEDRAAARPEFKVVPGNKTETGTSHTSTTQAATPKRRRSMLMPVAAATLAVLLLVGGVAYASGTFVTVGQAFDYLFKGAPVDTEVVGKIGRPLGASATSGSVTLTADAIIGDAHTYSVVYSLVREDGQPFEGLPAPNENDVIPLGFEHDLSSPVVFGGGGGTSWFYDADPNDAAIQYVEQYWWEPEGGRSIVGSTMDVELENLVLYTDKGTEAIAKGSWKMRFKLNYEDSSIAIGTGQAFDLNGMGATLSQASISPVSLYVGYVVDEEMPSVQAEVEAALAEGEATVVESDDGGTWTETTVISEEGNTDGRLSAESQTAGDKFLDLGTIRIHFADGTIMEVGDDAGGTIGTDAGKNPAAEGTTQCFKSIIFDKVIDLDQVTNIEFCGITISLG